MVKEVPDRGGDSHANDAGRPASVRYAKTHAVKKRPKVVVLHF
jgi:hypothetical protein